MNPDWKWLPPWDMPLDPVRAVFWFLHWSLRVLVRYFYLLILAGVAYEGYLNGVVGLLGTLLVGLIVWSSLAVVLVIANIATGFSQLYAQVNRLRQNASPFQDSLRSAPYEEENVVEGSIITDLAEERKKRRQEI